jgi:hypothetical protein
MDGPDRPAIIGRTGSVSPSSEQFGSVRLWTLDVDQLTELARTRLTRSLTEQECRQYLHLPACSRV